MNSVVSVIKIPANHQARVSARHILENEGRNSTAQIKNQLSDDFFKSLHFFVHSDATEEASKTPFNRGLTASPISKTAEGNAAQLTGAIEITEDLGARLLEIILNTSNFELLVPHSYAKASDMSRLPPESKVCLVTNDDEVNYSFNRRNASLPLIKKALGSMIPNYSVAWVLAKSMGQAHPILALVKIFDGDGWLVYGDLFRVH